MLAASLWVLAAVITATLIGDAVCRAFSKAVRERYSIPKPKFRETVGEVPAELTGIVERIFFAALVATDASGYAPAMVAWLALKLAASWTWPELDPESHAAQHSMRKSRIVSMLTGALSMLTALAAGLMARHAISPR